MRSRNTRCEYGPPPGKPGGGFFVCVAGAEVLGLEELAALSSVGAGFHPRPDVGLWNSPFCWRLSLGCAAYSTPFLWSCPKKRGGAPKKNAYGLVPTRERVWPHPPLPRAFGARVGQLRCPLRGRIVSLSPGARGLGQAEVSPVKVFCPAFLQKSGRGPGAEPLDARRSARNAPCAKEAQEGVKGGTLAGGPPFAGGSRRPQPARRREVGDGRRKGSSRTPTPTAGGKRAACRRIYCDIIPRLGRGWRNVVTPAKTVTAGRRGRRPLQGGCGDVSGGDSRRAGAEPRPTTDPWLYRLSTFFTQSRR